MQSQPPAIQLPKRPPTPVWIYLGQAAVLFVSLACYFLACVLPALHFVNSGNGPDPMNGFNILMIGWMGVFVGQFAWFANPFILLSGIVFLFRQWLASILVILVGLAISLNTFTLFGQEIPADEANVNKLSLVSLGPGYYLWIASMVVILGGAIVLWIASRAARRKAST